MGQKRPVSRSCAREEAALFGHEASRGTLWSRCASCRRVKAAPFGHEASRAHFGHAAPLAEEKRRHLLGTRPPGHTLVTLRLLQKRKGGTFWAQGFRGTLWSRCASCRREKAAPFGHKASRAHFGHAAPLAEEKRRHLLGTRLPGHTLVTPRLLQKRKGGTFWARGLRPPQPDQNSRKRDRTSVPPQEPKRFFDDVTAPRVPPRGLGLLKRARAATAARPPHAASSKSNTTTDLNAAQVAKNSGQEQPET